MAHLYSDENVSARLVERLRRKGHDILTSVMDGKANRGIEDGEVLARAASLGRCVLTNNRLHFHRLHRTTRGKHAGIATFTNDPDLDAWAGRIHAAVATDDDLNGKLIRITRRPR